MRQITMWIAAGLASAASVAAPAWAQSNQYEFRDGQWVQVAEPSRGTAAGELELLRRHLQQGNNRRAIKVARRIVKDYPAAPETEEAMLLAARAWKREGYFFKAYEMLERQLAEYPNGQFAAQARNLEFEIGQAFLDGKKRWVFGFIPVSAGSDGVEILQRVAERAPTSALAEQSLWAIAGYHYNARHYPEAADAYDRYVQSFPDTERAPRAMLQAARATFASFEGVRFEAAPLLDARQRFVVFRQRYPEKARRAGVNGILQQIYDLRAEKSYRAGRFYQRVDRNEAAAFYFRSTVNEFPSSPWARKSRQRLSEMNAPLDGPAATSRPDEPVKSPAAAAAGEGTPAEEASEDFVEHGAFEPAGPADANKEAQP